VHAEAQQRHQRHRQQRRAGAQRHTDALAVARRAEHEERQHQARGELQADARRQRGGGGARMRASPSSGAGPVGAGRAGSERVGSGSRGQRERRRKCQRQQRVVVRSPLGQRQHHGVQADECRSPRGGAPETAGGARDQGDGAEAREYGDRLERPQPARQPQRHERIAQQREQRTVGRVLKGPADELVHRVGGRFGGKVRVRVKAVQGPQARERQVTEHVLGDQRRSQQQDHVRDHDRHRDRGHPQPARRRQHQQVARAHDQHQRLEAGVREADAETAQRTGHPRRPATRAGGNELRRRRGGARAQERHAHDDAHQAQQAERAHNVRRPASVASVARADGRRLGDRSRR
jgi:hypothetical protein